MKDRSSLQLVGGLMAALAVVGMPYWLIPYSNLSLPNSLLAFSLLAPAALSFWARYSGRTWGFSFLLAASVPPAVVLLRVIADVVRDPTSHNLWPLEIMVACVIGAVASFAGVLIAWVLLKILKSARPTDT